jgi:cytoskeleton protein RodZ
MDSFGEKLRESRESQSYTLDQIARDTRISKRYLQALEEEDFSIFPGETYLIGFLRNYTQYLGLDAGEFISLYRNIKIQEQPIPMDELIHGKTKPSSALLWSGVFLGVVVIVASGYFLYRALRSRIPQEIVQEEGKPSGEAKEEFVFDSESETRWFTEGEAIRVVLGEEKYKIQVTSIEDNITLAVPGGMVRMELSETRFIDLNLDAKNDLKVVFNDIDKFAENKRVNLWLIKTATLLVEDKAEAAEPKETAAVETTTVEAGSTAEITPVAEASSAAETTEPAEAPLSVEGEGRIVVFDAESPRIFKVEINFRGNSLFRYLLDENTRDQRFFQKAESFSMDNVKREVTLWVSNAGALDTKVEGINVTLGRSGQVVTKTIRWVKDEATGRYQLEVISDY